MKIEFLDPGSRISGDLRHPFDLDADEVLFFIRIRGRESYFRNVYGRGLLSNFSRIDQPRCISEYENDADVYLDLNEQSRDYLTPAEFENFERIVNVNAVIQRCRGLRSVTRQTALSFVFRAYLLLTAYFRADTKTKLIVIGAIDNYVMHLLYLVGKDYGLTFLPITDSFMSPEYKLMIANGRPEVRRDVSDFEVDEVYEKIKKAVYAPRTYSVFRQYCKCYYLLASYLYRYLVRYLVGRKLRKKASYEHAFFKFINSNFRVLSFRDLGLLNSTVNKSATKTVYIPLHWYPEATTDYWIDDLFYVDYCNSLCGVIRELTDSGLKVLVKEHPHFLFLRGREEYQRLAAAGATLLSPAVSTRDVFDTVDLVLVYNGSTGIEAAVYGKPVAKLTNSYYGDTHVKSFDINAPDFSQYSVDKNTVKEMIRSVIEASFEPDFAE